MKTRSKPQCIYTYVPHTAGRLHSHSLLQLPLVSRGAGSKIIHGRIITTNGESLQSLIITWRFLTAFVYVSTHNNNHYKWRIITITNNHLEILNRIRVSLTTQLQIQNYTINNWTEQQSLLFLAFWLGKKSHATGLYSQNSTWRTKWMRPLTLLACLFT